MLMSGIKCNHTMYFVMNSKYKDLFTRHISTQDGSVDYMIQARTTNIIL